ncbi:DUF4303 domain-containing protein [Sanguibacter sp. 25GB23B1]|uniref:DUF4303 domain-containing protein n=1 Tax=unclassified Sanguibacter TaxID=2645534 RepID=UPI0032AF81CA
MTTDPPGTAVDWVTVEAALQDQVVRLVHEVRRDRPTDRVYGAAIHELYAEQGGVIAWPLVGVGTEGALDSLVEESAADGGSMVVPPEVLRWDTAAWPDQLDPGEAERTLAARVEAAAVADGGHGWDTVHERFLLAVVRACRAASRELVADGSVDADVVVVAMDEAWELVPQSLDADQVRRHFPEIADGPRLRS